jgi:hypothetical protein
VFRHVGFFVLGEVARWYPQPRAEGLHLPRIEEGFVMRSLAFVAVVLLVGIGGLGFYQGWFHFSTNSTDNKPSATLTVDKNKIHADEEKAKEKVEGLGQKVKETPVP